MIMVFIVSFLIGALGWYIGTTPEFFPALWNLGIAPDFLVTASMCIGMMGMFAWLFITILLRSRGIE